MDTTPNTNVPVPPDPNEVLRAKGLERIRILLEQGCEDAARLVDAQLGLGYFDPWKLWLRKFITLDTEMIELKEKIMMLSAHQDAVLIRGETGTGKELLAHALHGNRTGSFVDINCAGLPEQLIESELFGHTKGAFTGADKETDGLIMCAHKGTLFLDEVGELPMPLQAKLLRVLNNRKVRKVGGTEYKGPVDFRLIAATHQPIEAMLKHEPALFREDFFHRINTFQLWTKPLRDRTQDIRPIVLSLFPPDTKLPDSLVNQIAASPLSGNVRSIQSLVRHYQVFGKIC